MVIIFKMGVTILILITEYQYIFFLKKDGGHISKFHSYIRETSTVSILQTKPKVKYKKEKKLPKV